MKTHTLPFMAAFIAALAGMPTDIYRVCAWNVGTLKVEPWRRRLAAAVRGRARGFVDFLRSFCRSRLALTAATLVLALVVSHFISPDAGVACAAVPAVRLKLEADLAAASAKARDVMAAAEAAGREWTADERKQIQAHVDEAQKIQARLKEFDADEALRAQLTTLGRPLEQQHAGRQASRDGFASLGEFMQALAFESMGRGSDPRLAMMAAGLGLSSDVPSGAGMLVRRDWSDQLLARAVESSILLPGCLTIEIGEGSDAIDMPVVDEISRADGSRWGGVQAYWATEGGTVTASKPKVDKRELRLEELKALCYATERNLRDATALQSLIQAAFTSEFAFKIDDAIFGGDGAGKPLGFTKSPALVSVAKEGAQLAKTIVWENIVKMYSRMHPRFLGGAKWYYNPEIFPELATMAHVVGGGGVPVYLPANGAASAPYGTLMGLPMQPLEHCAALGTKGDLVLANMAAYLVIRKGGLAAASSMHVRFIYDEMTFRFTLGINGQPIPKAPLTPKNGAAGFTLSPFVSLDTRA